MEKELLNKIYNLISVDEIACNSTQINLGVLEYILLENFKIYKKYSNSSRFNIKLSLIEDIKQYRKCTNSNFLKGLYLESISFCILNEDELNSVIKVLLTDSSGNSVEININRVVGSKGYSLSINDDRFKKLQQEELNEIRAFISNYNDKIYIVLNDLDNISNIFMLNTDNKDYLYLFDGISFVHDKFLYDKFSIEFFTDCFGKSKIYFDLEDIKDNELFQKLNSVFIKKRDYILKRLPINIDDLNPVYKKIVLESDYYKTLKTLKKLEKKPN